MKRLTLSLLLVLWTPVFSYAASETKEGDQIYRGTMTASALADFLKEIEPSLRSVQHTADNKNQIIYTSDEKFRIHDIKIHTHYIEVFLKSTEHSTEREMHRFEVIEGKWKRTHRKTFGIY
jgi:hypothetical protein